MVVLLCVCVSEDIQRLGSVHVLQVITPLPLYLTSKPISRSANETLHLAVYASTADIRECGISLEITW